MSRKLVFVLSLFLLLSLLLRVRIKPVEVKAPEGYPVHNLHTRLNYTTIQEAINAPETVDGHTILVDPGTYCELVRVQKSVSLIGKNKTTIIDGNRTGTVIRVTADNVYISGFTIRNSSEWYLGSGVFLDNTRNTTIADNVICGGDVCIFLNYSRGNSILDNTITNPDGEGVCLRSSSGNKISGNNISEVDFGIILEDSSDNNIISDNNITKTGGTSVGLSSSSFNTLRNNALSKFGVWGSSLEHFIHDIDESNTVGGKPLYYWVNQHGRQVPSDAGYVVAVNSTDITVKDLTSDGRLLFVHTNNSRIENITIETLLDYGIRLYFSNNNTISNNQLTKCGSNIHIISSNNNVFIGNNVTRGGFYNLVLDSSSGNIVADNILSFSKRGGVAGAGVMIWDGGNNTISGNTMNANLYGVYMTNSSNNIIYNNVIRKSWWGILIQPTPFSFKYSTNNIIYNNLIAENSLGIALYARCENNSIYHNNFIDNGEQAYVNARHTNSWDSNVEGNYWSNYTGVDLNHDGIGDSWHQINENNTDHYPLMGMFNSFNTSLDCDVDVISNSTIEDFEYFESNSTVRMRVSNMTANQTCGFCRLCIPKSLMSPPYTVIIDYRLTEALYFNNTIYDNTTHRWIYFAYPHSTHEIHIIPEFQSIIIILLLMVATLLAATIYGSTRYRSPQEH
ncbi:MAG: right-handed parallel beta-helix repeat-containing protein [Candidatus Bathyarchaeota archaeon]|nr:right-handed parallel beta-helix repeat-containing protein [Candidatus Bathyarchaeota archaeon]MDH5747074.1 right-handed parallel beta-helix repeat-containing protein [Candidatus Bathyarchaeota archaeon]